MFYGKGKRKLIASYKSDDIYKFYLHKYGEKALSKEKFWSIWNAFIEARMKMVIFENLELYLPYRLGSLRIRLGGESIKIDKNGNVKYSIDYGASNKLWQKMYPNLSSEEIKKIPKKPKVYFTNEHTNGRRLYWFWDKLTSNFKNKSAYRLDITRKWDRMLSLKVQKTKKIEYYE